MTRRMLIDATHPEETRVTVVSGNRVEEFDYESSLKATLKGNIYLAKITRVEPSLQAAFVEYGGNRQGFLSFSEIHPDYCRIPIEDREDFLEDAEEARDGDDAAFDAGREPDDDNRPDTPAAGFDGDAPDTQSADGTPDDGNGDADDGEAGNEAVDEAVAESRRWRPRIKKRYKIQEVIKRHQIVLVQVVKEERGNKGAALTTYLSLAGRYCVLMPNTSRGGGVSRKITNEADRKRLKSVLGELELPDGMAIILRTAGAERSRVEIRRDYDYILKLWNLIRERTLASSAPTLIHEEANLIKRSLRDLYSKDMDCVIVAGDEAYRTAKDFMKNLIPSHAKKVQPYRDDSDVPLLHHYQVEQQLAQIHDPVVQLKSGGSVVIHQTEALVAIDVNSGRATRQRHIEDTALKTNLEAADEVARQLRLRDLAGLIVIDFIDMEESRYIQQVERRLKEALKRDRARIQVGRISAFGLMEMSRQRLRPSLIETTSDPCPTCGGVGYIASTETSALTVLRAVEEEALRGRGNRFHVRVPINVALYILNHKRGNLADIEARYNAGIVIETGHDLVPPKYELSLGDRHTDGEGKAAPARARSRLRDRPHDHTGGEREREGERERTRARGPRRSEPKDHAVEAKPAAMPVESPAHPPQPAADDGAGGDDRTRRRRRRGRRGGRRRNRDSGAGAAAAEASTETGVVAGGTATDTGSDDRLHEAQATPAGSGVMVAAGDADSASDPGGDVSSGVNTDMAAESAAPRQRKGAAAKKPGARTPAATRGKKSRARKPSIAAPKAPAPLLDDRAAPVPSGNVQPMPAPLAAHGFPAANSPAAMGSGMTDSASTLAAPTPGAASGPYGDGAPGRSATAELPHIGDATTQAKPASAAPKRRGWWNRLMG